MTNEATYNGMYVEEGKMSIKDSSTSTSEYNLEEIIANPLFTKCKNIVAQRDFVL